MAILEAVMVITGLLAVFLSFKASDNNNTGSTDEGIDTAEGVKNITEEAKKALEKFGEEVQSNADEVLNNTDDKLGTILNEKIMGLSEYSGQILDKMEKNHSETVFLYDMLNEKEKEIKELVHDIDVIKAEIRDELAKEYQEHRKHIEETEVYRTGSTEMEVAESNTVQSAGLDAASEGIPDELLYANPGNMEETKNTVHASMYDAEIARIEEQERHEKSLRRLYGNMGISDIEAEAIEAGIEHVNHNDEIISLHKKGHTVLEISKMLDIGQGEVKLVIDMYKAS